jgi:aminopeptidase N
MRRNPFLDLVLILLLGSISLAFPQKLPAGRYHPNRERNFDLLHYKGELRFDFEKRKVFGKSTITLAPLRTISSFSLDAIHLDVQSVAPIGANGKLLPFRMTGTSLDITLLNPKTPADTFTVAVQYEAQPQSGMYFRPDPSNPEMYFVSTYGEGGLHANWLPIYNDVNDKFSSEMVVTVPAPYTAISNGKLLNARAAAGQNIFHWAQKLPHPNYLISVYVGDFEKGNLAPAFGTIPLSYWVPRGRLNEGAYAFRNTTKMVEFFSERFNYRYPWDKYDQIAVPDYAIGAMEHTGVTGLRASVLREAGAPLDFDLNFDDYYSNWTAESTISHELAHHWFGDNLTCRNLSLIWLNESFASYLMMLWDEESGGKDLLDFDAVFAKKHYFNFVHRQNMIRPLEYRYFDDPNTIYNTEHTYLKGAVVLHMLRRILGDESFFRAMSYYLHKHEFGNVESHDVKIAIEEATGQNLDWFFKQWITGAGHPVFAVNHEYSPARKELLVNVNQVQPRVEGQNIFTLPVKITITTAKKRWQEEVWIKNESESLAFGCEEKPLLVSFDGEGDLVAELAHSKSVEELVYQSIHDELPGRMWAMKELATRHAVDPRTVKTLSDIAAGNGFWGIRAEAAKWLGEVRTPAAEQALTHALKADAYQVRKGAVLALGKFGTASAQQKLREAVKRDASADVAATAILTLAQSDPKLEDGFIKEQLGRNAWCDEFKVACLRAIKVLAKPEWTATIRPYTTPENSQFVVDAALSAWEACAPDDKELHRTLMELTDSPVYSLKQYAIHALGRLRVYEAREPLHAMLLQQADDNLVVAAKNALQKIDQVTNDTN